MHPTTEQMYYGSSWVNSCFLRLLKSVNRLRQLGNLHSYGFSPVCVRICTFRLPFVKYFLLHPFFWQMYCGSPWVFSCLLRLWDQVNPFIQSGYEHSYGFSPVCIRWCSFILLDDVNCLRQSANVHTYGFSPVCIRWCSFILLDDVNCLRQSANVHTYGFSPVCIRWCSFRLLDDVNCLRQSANVHKYGFSPVCIRICLSSLC